jgi:hypothetical protein
VISVTTSAADQGVKMPPGAEDGDYFELHRVSGANPYFLYAPGGGVIASASSNSGFSLFVRKLPTGWAWWN